MSCNSLRHLEKKKKKENRMQLLRQDQVLEAEG